MKNKDKKNVLIGIFLVVGLFLGYNYYVSETSPLSQSFVSWTQDDTILESKAIINQPVTLNIFLQSKSVYGYNGNVYIDIKKDVTLTDPIYVHKVVGVEIPAGLNQKVPVKITFTPDEATDGLEVLGYKTGVKEYFYKITTEDDKVVYNPTESGNRNGLQVSSTVTSAPGTTPTGSVSLISVNWNVKANQASTATLNFRISGTYNQQIKVDVRQDIAWYAGLTDKDLSTQQVTVSGTNTDVSATVNFVAPNAGEYVFVRVPGIYDCCLINGHDTRISQGTEIQVTSTGTGGGTTPNPTPQPTTNPTAQVSYNIIELKSNVANGMRINVPQGTQVDVYVTYTSNMQTSGQISVEVRKDLENFVSDTTLQVLSKSVNLQAGTNTVLVGSFQANDLTGSNNFRQYFFKPSWNGKLLNDPTDPNNRECVTTYYSGGGTTPNPTPQPTQTPSGAKVSFNAAEFVTDYEGGLNIRVPTGTTVQIYANLNTNQPTTGTINIEVKKDMVWATDTTVQNIQRSITLPIVGNNNIQIGTFVASDLTDFSFRQYFVKVSWNGNVIYDPTDPNNRETVTTCSSNTQWC